MRRRAASIAAIVRGVTTRAPALALLLLVLAGRSSAAQRTELEKRIQRTTLANGLEVIVVENHGVPLVTMEAVAARRLRERRSKGSRPL